MKGAIVFGVILASAIVSRLFIFSFKHIPLTNQTGGQELLYAFIGGAALAFSVPMLPLVVVYLTVLFSAGKDPLQLDRSHRAALVPAAPFLLAFVATFVVTISGVPFIIANAIYKGKTIINLIGGVLVAFCGLKTLIGSGVTKALWFRPLSKTESGILVEAPILGLIAGLLLFHHLDPFYDSVFFFTGRAGAFSHHPLSVGSFGLGLSAMYLGLAYSFRLVVASMRLAKAGGWLKLIFGLLTLILGFSFATGTFSSVADLIRWTSSLVSGS
jgi:cytochrome c biogenesis protein CcdA